MCLASNVCVGAAPQIATFVRELLPGALEVLFATQQQRDVTIVECLWHNAHVHALWMCRKNTVLFEPKLT